jgi:hypothetical protein
MHQAHVTQTRIQQVTHHDSASHMVSHFLNNETSAMQGYGTSAIHMKGVILTWEAGTSVHVMQGIRQQGSCSSGFEPVTQVLQSVMHSLHMQMGMWVTTLELKDHPWVE